MRRRTGSLLVCLALLACGGNDTATSSTGSVEPSATATTAPASTGTTAADQRGPVTSESVPTDTGLPAEPGGSLATDAVMAVTDAFAARLGTDEAFDAVVLALDGGYSFGQLVDAASAGTLTADGTISGTDPVHEPYGLIVGDVAAVTEGASGTGFGWVAAVASAIPIAAPGSTPTDADHFKAELESDLGLLLSSPLQVEWERERAERAEQRAGEGLAILDFLLHLAATGYSFEQIIDGVLFGEITMLKAPPEEVGSFCFGLTEFGSDGALRAITPALRAATSSSKGCQRLSEELRKGDDTLVLARTSDSNGWFDIGVTGTATTTTTMPEADTGLPLPWTYEGTIRREETYVATFGAEGRNTAVNDDHIVVTLLADGTVEGTYTRGGNGSVFECDDPANAGQIYPGAGEAEVDQITTWTHGDGVLTRPFGNVDVHEYEGTYDADALVLSWTYSTAITIGGCFEGTFTLEVTADGVVPRTSPPAGE